ncbi:MAG: PAS domain S-box protein [Sediminibacterium sp.]|uniref:PAS domain S-box protein n=1 Tax=Sediminibacterium sp. TaxID=1917865 RepID=UPI002ABA3B2C|nr:PAS domain S-box protein [Sediminibacterium sp.]MDZ4072592.1 PAS domain S-box protein [Sediminibacterium sp.]
MSEKQKSSIVAGTHLTKDAVKKPVLVFIIPDHSLSLDQLVGSFIDPGKICFVICGLLSSAQKKQLNTLAKKNKALKLRSIQSDSIPSMGDILVIDDEQSGISFMAALRESKNISSNYKDVIRLLNQEDGLLKIILFCKELQKDDLESFEDFAAHLIVEERFVNDELLALPEANIMDMCLPVNEMSAAVEKIISGKLRLRNRSFHHLTTLQQSHQLAENINQQIDGILWEANAQTFEFTYISPQVEKILGYTVHEWMSQKDFWQTHIHPDDRDGAVNLCHCETVAGRDHVFEYRMIAKNGKEIWVHDRVTIECKKGIPSVLRGVMIDITREKEIQRRLLQEKQLTDLLVHNLPNVFFLFNAEGKFLLWNRMLENISGYSHEEVAKMSPFDFFSDEVKPLIKANIELTYQEGYTEIEAPFIAKNKRLIPLHFTARQITYMGEPCIYGVGTDLSKVKKAMLELSQMINNTDEAFLLLDTALNIITFNNRFNTLYKDLLGITVRKGECILEYAEEKRVSQLKDMYQQVLNGAELANEINITGIDGLSKAFSVRYKPALDDHDKVIGVFVTATDITSEKLVKEELLVSEQRYKYLFDNNPAPMFIWDFETKQILDCNDAALLKYGYSRDEFLQLTILDIRPVEDIDRILSVTSSEEIYTNYGKSLHADTWRHLKKNGEIMDVEITGHILDFKGRKAALVLIHDVTEQKRADAQLQLSEQRFKSLIQDGSDLIGILDITGNYSYVSPTSVSVLGIEPSEFIGKNAFDFIHPDDKEEVISQFSRLVTDKRISIPPFRFKNKDGEWRWIETVVTNLLDDPAIMGIVANSRDVTDKEHLFRELKASESRYRGFYDSQTNFVIRTDMEGKYSYYNKKFEETFGWLYPDGNILGKSCLDSICAYDHPKVFEVVQKCIDTPETVYKVELDKPLEDGSVLTTLWDFTCVTDAEGKPFEIQCMGIDITERIQFEKSLRESNERYEYINKAANDAIYDWDTTNDKFYWGESFTRIFGHQVNISNFTLDDLAKLVHPNDVVVAQKELQAFLADPTRNSWTFECRLQRADGTYAYIKQIGYLIRNSDGSPKRMIGALRDVSENRELQQLVNNATKLSRIGAWEVDVKRNTLYWSPMTKKIHEVEDDFVPSIEDGVSFYREDVREEVGSIVLKAMQKGEAFDFEMPLITAKGNECWVRAIGEVEIFDGEVIRVFGSFQDINERKIAQLRLQNTADNIPGAMFQFQLLPDGTDRLMNLTKGGADLWGYSPEKCMANTDLVWQQIKAGGDYDHVIETMYESANTLNRWYCLWRSRKPDGSIRWHEGLGSPRKLSDGSILWDSIITDVTEKQRLEQLLEKASQMAKIGSWEKSLTNDQTDDMYWSAMTRQILEVDDGYNPSLTGGFEFYNEKSKQLIQNAVEVLINEGKEFDLELLLTTAKGNQRWVRCIGEAEISEGKCTRIYGSFQDIHERKVAELEIKGTNERFEKVTKATNDAIWDWDILTDQTYLGEGFQTLFGYDLSNVQHDLILREWSGLIHEEDAELVKKHFKLALESSNIYKWQMEYRYKKANGSYAFVQDKALIIRDDQLKAIRVVGAMSDITYRKEYEESLRRLNTSLDAKAKDLAVSNAELEQFAYVASHDLQEPLRMVTSFLTQLHKKYHDQLDDKANQYIHYAVDGAKRMRQIILDLLEYSRVGKHDSTLETIEVKQIIEEIQLLQRQRMIEKNASIHYDELPVIQFYKVPLTQIFQNLIGNALKYSKDNERPRIMIKSEVMEHYYLFSVADNGIGISEEFHEKVFEIFQRLHSRNEYEGTGMGLAIVKKILENLGGKIWLESEEGEGSTFYFTIPK